MIAAKSSWVFLTLAVAMVLAKPAKNDADPKILKAERGIIGGMLSNLLDPKNHEPTKPEIPHLPLAPIGSAVLDAGKKFLDNLTEAPPDNKDHETVAGVDQKNFQTDPQPAGSGIFGKLGNAIQATSDAVFEKVAEKVSEAENDANLQRSGYFPFDVPIFKKKQPVGQTVVNPEDHRLLDYLIVIASEVVGAFVDATVDQRGSGRELGQVVTETLQLLSKSVVAHGKAGLDFWTIPVRIVDKLMKKSLNLKTSESIREPVVNYVQSVRDAINDTASAVAHVNGMGQRFASIAGKVFRRVQKRMSLALNDALEKTPTGRMYNVIKTVHEFHKNVSTNLVPTLLRSLEPMKGIEVLHDAHEKLKADIHQLLLALRGAEVDLDSLITKYLHNDPNVLGPLEDATLLFRLVDAGKTVSGAGVSLAKLASTVGLRVMSKLNGIHGDDIVKLIADLPSKVPLVGAFLPHVPFVSAANDIKKIFGVLKVVHDFTAKSTPLFGG